MRHDVRPEKDGGLKDDHLRPGQTVSVDQYVSKIKGRLPHTRGKETSTSMYVGGTIYIDHASSFIYCVNQVSLETTGTLQGKHDFEREARSCGVSIGAYRGDNGIFRSKGWIDDLQQRSQHMEFSGVGAHHQNGVVERAIRTITESARTMLLHATIHWPDSMSLELWPFALHYAVKTWNHLPRQDTKLAPIEVFTGLPQDPIILRDFHVFGCPAYVLDPTLQDKRKLPRWNPRSRRGQFLGMSRRHANNIGLIRNLQTHAVSTQFHVVYDDRFTTLPTNGLEDQDNNPPAD